MSVGRSPVALLKLKSTHGGNSICEFSQANPTKLFLLGSIIFIYTIFLLSRWWTIPLFQGMSNLNYHNTLIKINTFHFLIHQIFICTCNSSRLKSIGIPSIWSTFRRVLDCTKTLFLEFDSLKHSCDATSATQSVFQANPLLRKVTAHNFRNAATEGE